MITIKSKALKVGDIFKVSPIKRKSYLVTKTIDLDPEGNSSCPHRAGNVLVFSGCKQFTMNKNLDVLRYEK